jgi:hypothetical protein
LNGLAPLWCVSSFLLLDVLERWMNTWLVLNHLLRVLGHIWYLPCEDIDIFPEKGDKREFLFGFKLCAEMKLLISVIGVYRYFLVSAPFFLLSTGWWVMGWFDVEPTHVLFFSAGGRSVLTAGGLGAAVLIGVLPPWALATFAANSCASFSPNRSTCVSAAFSHAKASHRSELRTIMPFHPGILMVA